jgi:hypothetical protein
MKTKKYAKLTKYKLYDALKEWMTDTYSIYETLNHYGKWMKSVIRAYTSFFYLYKVQEHYSVVNKNQISTDVFDWELTARTVRECSEVPYVPYLACAVMTIDVYIYKICLIVHLISVHSLYVNFTPNVCLCM